MLHLVSLLGPFISAKGDAVERSVTNLSLAGKDVIGSAASQTANSPALPIEAMLAILAGLLLSAFVLLLRESRIETRETIGRR